jgi:hypothetical protein
MNVEIGTVAAQFLFWKYLVEIFGIGCLQCKQLHKHVFSIYLPFLFSLGLKSINTARKYKAWKRAEGYKFCS